MDFPPSTWKVIGAQEFGTAVATDPGDLVVELHAQLRDTGRILDNYRVTFGGSKIVEMTVGLSSVLGVNTQWRFKYAFWPRDVQIRQNLMSSQWVDMAELVATKDASVVDSDGAVVDHASVMELLKEGDCPMAMRMAVAVADDGVVHLECHGLPASAAMLKGKPLLRG
jgi:hypothetical protein